MSTYTPNDALVVCGGFIRQMAIPGEITTVLMDQVNSAFWNYKPDWNWTKAALRSIPLTDGVQDYSLNALDTRVYRFLNLRITRTDVTPNISRGPLDIAEWIEPDVQSKSVMESQNCIAWVASISKLRLEKPISMSGTVVYQIDGEYQLTRNKIDAGALVTEFDFPDHYFECFTEGFLYRLYKFTGDDRAGTVVVSKSGNRQYTGQLAVWMMKLQETAEQEDTASGQQYRYPAEPLGLSRGGWPGPTL